MSQVLVEVRKVTKNLGKRKVLNNVSLTINSGEVVGITGSNGSGKTTLLRLIAGLVYPDHGDVIVSGKHIKPGITGKIPTGIGILIESPSFLPQFSGYRNLKLLADIRRVIGRQEIRVHMRKIGLDPQNRQAVRKYSLGMRQRLGIVQATMERPKVLLLDEPTNSLDAEAVTTFTQMIQQLRGEGVAVLLASHMMADIDRLCDRVLILRDGNLSIIRNRRERNWRIVLYALEDFEKIRVLVPSLQFGERINGLPTATCKGEWEQEELVSLLLNQSIKFDSVQELV